MRDSVFHSDETTSLFCNHSRKFVKRHCENDFIKIHTYLFIEMSRVFQVNFCKCTFSSWASLRIRSSVWRASKGHLIYTFLRRLTDSIIWRNGTSPINSMSVDIHQPVMVHNMQLIQQLTSDEVGWKFSEKKVWTVCELNKNDMKETSCIFEWRFI